MSWLLPPTAITAPQSGTPSQPLKLPAAPRNLTIEGEFTYGSGGTSVDAYVQTTLDGGATWIDVAQFHFTTSSASGVYNLSALAPDTTQIVPTSGSLAANTAVDGILGPQFRVLLNSAGTYAGTTAVAIYVASDQLPAFP